MSRIHPAENQCAGKYVEEEENCIRNCEHDPYDSPCVLTVWKRSSMSFQGTDGFTVFDSCGKLAFRVDNYTRKDGGGLVLMDGSGNALLTLKPQMLSMQYQWNGYRGEAYRTSPKSREFAMRRPRSALIHSITSSSSSNNKKKCEAEVFMGSSSSSQPNKQNRISPDFKVEGSFRRRNCKIKTSSGALVANIARKRVVNSTVLLSDDVFSLAVQPGYEPQLIMAFIVILDRLSPKPFAPVLCS
ncbi:protein LURP-one-related 5-like [Actinidia eriantha]|uniref:protein LURP-one-related 5-like n=1 Tax=Actinidia eriantha TaxID=165200 RepID=UPI002585D291|nr:protein LURP-one-related 5-like [Actinidia eriantha]